MFNLIKEKKFLYIIDNYHNNLNGALIMSENCIFCKIVAKQSPAGIVFENDLVVAFLDIRPVNTGHILVIPKKHFVTVDEIDSEEIFTELFKIGKKVHLLLKEKFPMNSGYNYLIANGKDAGQEVFHVHLHIIPRKPNDGFGFKFGPNYGKTLSVNEIQGVLSILKK